MSDVPPAVRRISTHEGLAIDLFGDPPLRGGEAAVYAATAADGAPIAVKVALFPGEAGAWLDEERRRVEALMRTAAAPYLVPVVASGSWAGRPFLVMPWMPRTLEAFVAEGPSMEARRAVCRELCAALVAVQRADPSFVHRDLKPTNVFLDDARRVRLGDLGAARTRLTGATTTTAALYTPGFAPPEQAFPGPQRPDPAWDAYALAATVWFVLVGERLRAPAHNARCLTPLGHRVLAGRATGSAAECLDLRSMGDLLPEDRAAWARSVGDAALLRVLQRMLAPDAARRSGTPSDLERALGPTSRKGLALAALLGLGAIAIVAVASVFETGAAPVGPAYDVVRLPAGTYVVGAVERGPWRQPWDVPSYDFTLDHDVLFGETEVSQALWTEVTGGDRSPADDRQIDAARDEWCGAMGPVSLLGPDLPVHCITWREAVGFANALSAAWGLEPAYDTRGDDVIWDRTASGWRLPTAAEWEAAARFGRTVDFEGGDRDLGCEWRNILDQSYARAIPDVIVTAACDDGYPGLAPVRSFRPGPSGAYGLGGNAAEWVWDDTAPGNRGVRGSSFTTRSPVSKYSLRGWTAADTKGRGLGMRLVRNAP